MLVAWYVGKLASLIFPVEVKICDKVVASIDLAAEQPLYNTLTFGLQSRTWLL